MLLQFRFPNRNFRPARFDTTGEAVNLPKRGSLLKEILSPLHWQPYEARQLLHCLKKNWNSRHRA